MAVAYVRNDAVVGRHVGSHSYVEYEWHPLAIGPGSPPKHLMSK